MSVNNDLLKDKHWIIYGAGKKARMVFGKLLYENVDITHFKIAVTDRTKEPEAIFGIPVFAINELKEQHEMYAVLIAVSYDKEIFIKENLCRLGFKNVYSINDEYKTWANDSYYKRYVDPYIETVRQLCIDQKVSLEETDKNVKKALEAIKDQNKINLARLVVILGTKCSLKCKECNNLIPYFREKRDFDKKSLIKSLDNFLDKVHILLRCELVGGEPFLSDNLQDILQYLINKKNVCQIEITTNGTIVPKDYLISLLKNSKVKVRISDYGRIVHTDNLINFLDENQINYQILKSGKWISPGGIHKRGRGVEKLKRYYANCSSAYYCKTLFDGKLFSCARSASLSALGYMEEKEYLEINADIIGETIKDFWLMDYSEACDYCDIVSEGKRWVEPAEQF